MEESQPEILVKKEESVINYMKKIFDGYNLEDAKMIKDKLDLLQKPKL